MKVDEIVFLKRMKDGDSVDFKSDCFLVKNIIGIIRFRDRQIPSVPLIPLKS